jgi:hypothetical protein
MTVQVDRPTALRVGLIIDSFVQPRWVRKSLEDILAADVSVFAVLVRVTPEKKNRNSLLYKLSQRMYRSFFRAPATALELVGIDDLVGSCPVVLPSELENIKAFNLDVLMNFGPTQFNSKLATLAKHGVWFYAFEANDDSHQNLQGFDAVMDQEPITISSLRSLIADGTERIIYQSVSPTLGRFSIGLTNNSCYLKSAAFIARSLVDLYQGHNAELNNVSHRTANSFVPPTNAAMGLMLLKLSGRAVSRTLAKLSSFEQWVLAYRFNDTEFKYLIPPSDRFWADPFPLRMQGRYYIFFEEYLNAAGKAHISVIEVDRKGIVRGPTEVLKLDCHLSYPFVFEWQGDYYMVPETGEKNVVELYRSVSFPFEWQREKILLEANCPLDATLIEVKGTWWMFVNIQEQGVTINWDELHLYYSENLRGPWRPHARNPIVSDVRSARPAGRLFWSNSVLYRPSQDSSVRYGYATTISKVTSLSPLQYSETEVLKIKPDWHHDVLGIHTLNFLDEMTVIDCLTKRSRFRNSQLRPPKGSLDLLSSANMMQP